MQRYLWALLLRVTVTYCVGEKKSPSYVGNPRIVSEKVSDEKKRRTL